jgi:hypothetical protein
MKQLEDLWQRFVVDERHVDHALVTGSDRRRESMTCQRAGVRHSRPCRATLPLDGHCYARSSVTLASTFAGAGLAACQSRTIHT